MSEEQELEAADARRRAAVTLMIPAFWLILQAVILVVGLAVFSLRPGVVAERFTGMLAGLAIAAVLVTAARGLLRCAPLGHIVAVAIFALESLAFALSLLQGRGGAWQTIQLVIALAMLALLFVRPSRDSISRSTNSQTEGEMPTYIA
ncbi:MAG: hypothetical protein DCC49_12805 [Acidobacteria bacterium]|nr:MAG: hypothetical protein DCC49_12805 [Acidobacteriota bacterium]